MASLSTGATITDLSHEILCNILKHLGLKEILAIGMLSKKLRDATKMHFELCKSIDFCPTSINGYMPSSITDENLHVLLRKCPQLETIYGLHPIRVERRRSSRWQRKRSSLTVSGIIEALSLCNSLKAIETCDLRVLEAIMQHLPHVEIIGHFQNRDGVFPPQASQKLKLQNFSRITSLHLIGVEVIELTAMQHLKHLRLHCVRFTKQHPFRSFFALNLRTFVMKHCIGPAVSLRYLSLIITLSASLYLNHLELVRVPFQGGSFYRAVEDSHGHGFVNLKTLVISGCKGVLESDLGHLMIVSSKNLETLYIQPSLTKDSLFVSLSFAQCRFPNLRNLHLGYIDSLNISGEWSLENLLSLGLSEIPDTPSSITDCGMKTVGQLLPQIKFLSVSNCPHLMSMYQWMPSIDVPSWTELTDLTLQKCHCLLLSSFTIFVSIVPNLQIIILYEMFKEPPKGCSHVGLSAGTGLGMSSAVVSNQDEHLAVQGHPVQDFDHPGEEENEELDRDLLEAENEDNQEPHFMLLRGDFFEDDDDIDYVEYENRCINEALRQQDRGIMYDMMNVSSDSSSDASDVDEHVGLKSTVSVQSEPKTVTSDNGNGTHSQRSDSNFQKSSRSVASQTFPSYDLSKPSTSKAGNSVKCKNGSSRCDSNLHKPSISKERKLNNNKNSSSSNVSYDPHQPSTSKAKNIVNYKSTVLQYDPNQPQTSKAGKTVPNKKLQTSTCNNSINISHCDPDEPSTAKSENNVNSKSDNSLSVPHESSREKSHLFCTNSESSDVKTQEKCKASAIMDYDLSKPSTSKAECSPSASSYDKSCTKRSQPSQKQNFSKKAKIFKAKNVDEVSKFKEKTDKLDSVDHSSMDKNEFIGVEHHSDSNPILNNVCKPCYVHVIKLKNDVLTTNKNYSEQENGNVVASNFNYQNEVKKESENSEEENDCIFRSTNFKYQNEINGELENSANLTSIKKKIYNHGTDLLNNQDRELKIKCENDELEECDVPQLVPGLNYLKYTNSIELPNSVKNAQTNMTFRSLWYHPHLGTITCVPDTSSSIGNYDYGKMTGNATVNGARSHNCVDPQPRTSSQLEPMTSARKQKKSVCNYSAKSGTFQQSNSLVSTESQNKSVQKFSKAKPRTTRKLEPLASTKSQNKSVYSFSNAKPETSRQSDSFVFTENQNKPGCSSSDANPGTSRQSGSITTPENLNKSAFNSSAVELETFNSCDVPSEYQPLSDDTDFYVILTYDSRFPNKCYNSINGDYFDMRECSFPLKKLRVSSGEHKVTIEDTKKFGSGVQFTRPIDATAGSSTSICSKDCLSTNHKKTVPENKKRRNDPINTSHNKKSRKSTGKEYSDKSNKDSTIKWKKPSIVRITRSVYDIFEKTRFNQSLDQIPTCRNTENPKNSKTQYTSLIKKKKRKRICYTKKSSKRNNPKKVRSPENNRAGGSKTRSFLPTISLISQGTQANSADIRRSVRRVRLASSKKSSTSSSTLSSRSSGKSSKISAKMSLKRPKKINTNEMLDKATSTSDPLLEDDAVQVLKISCGSLLSFTVIACGISDLIIDQCAQLNHLDVQACRILKKLEINTAHSIKRVNVGQCPKLTIQELSQAVMSIVADTYFLVTFEPCMQGYHQGEGEKAILENARLNQALMICHDFHEPSDESIQSKFRDKIWKWFFYLSRLPGNLKYTREKLNSFQLHKSRKSDIVSSAFPYQHDIRRIHGEYLGPPTSEFCGGGQYQLLTNNIIIAEAFETCKPDKGFPYPKDCETFKNSSRFSLEAMERHLHVYKNMVAFYIPITENNRTESYKLVPVI